MPKKNNPQHFCVFVQLKGSFLSDVNWAQLLPFCQLESIRYTEHTVHQFCQFKHSIIDPHLKMLLIVYLVCPGLRFYTLWKPSSQIEIIFLNAQKLGLARSLPLVFTPVRIPRETSNWPENTGSAHTAPKRETICRDSCLPTQCPVSQHIGESVCGLLTQDHLTDLSNAEFGRADYPVVAEITSRWTNLHNASFLWTGFLCVHE